MKIILCALIIIQCSLSARADQESEESLKKGFEGCYKLNVPMGEQVFTDYLQVRVFETENGFRTGKFTAVFTVPGVFKAEAEGTSTFTGPWGQLHFLEIDFVAIENGREIGFKLNMKKSDFNEDTSGTLQFKNDETPVEFTGRRISSDIDFRCP